LALFGVSLTREVEQVKFALGLEANHDRPSKINTRAAIRFLDPRSSSSPSFGGSVRVVVVVAVAKTFKEALAPATL
jgi:hypothetical protein